MKKKMVNKRLISCSTQLLLNTFHSSSYSYCRIYFPTHPIKCISQPKQQKIIKKKIIAFELKQRMEMENSFFLFFPFFSCFILVLVANKLQHHTQFFSVFFYWFSHFSHSLIVKFHVKHMFIWLLDMKRMKKVEKSRNCWSSNKRFILFWAFEWSFFTLFKGSE